MVAEAHMDALRVCCYPLSLTHDHILTCLGKQHWFFWTWKTGFSSTLGKIANPMWNYQSVSLV